jgi:prepilin-type N-terminal cleavage/methylation domain-containing protein
LNRRIPFYYHPKDFKDTDPKSKARHGGTPFPGGGPVAVFALRNSKDLRHRGFTLVELVVSITVLVLVMVTVAQIVSDTQRISTASEKSLGADSEARMVFDRIAVDVALMVKRVDVDYLLNRQAINDSLFFYSEAPAFPVSGSTIQQQNSVALVGYRINSQYQLERLGKGLTWNAIPSDGMVFLTYASFPLTASSTPVSGSTLLTAFPTVVNSGSTDANYHVLGPDVFRFEFCYLLSPYTNSAGIRQPATYSNVPWNSSHQYAISSSTIARTDLTGIGLSDVQALVFSMAVLDSTSRKMLPSSSSLSTAASLLKDPLDSDLASTPPKLMATTWQGVMNSGSFVAGAGIPKAAANQVRVYQRVFPLNTP